jgi:alpha-galactosidase
MGKNLFIPLCVKFFIALILISGILNAQDLDANKLHKIKEGKKILALTPPMGWNSWDCFGTTVTEQDVKANAEYMAKHLLRYGWSYIVVDIQWYEPNAKSHGYRKDAELTMDSCGRLLPAVNRFPSAANGKGFKPLADYIHSLGLKFGIHIMRGIPRQAVKQNLSIYNSFASAKEIVDTLNVCPWNTDMYGIKIDVSAGQTYYDSIVRLYAEWGVDYIKADDMSASNNQPADKGRLNEIDALSRAIKKSDRQIVLSLSPGPASTTQASFLKEHAQLWRISDDFWDKWSDIIQQFGFMRNWYKYISVGAWPDADMLPLGKIGIRAERGSARQTRFTKEEQFTLMTLWSIFRSPLMFGGNLPDNDEFTLSLITNEEVLAVNQKSVGNKELYAKGDTVVWTADIPETKEKYVALFNISNSEMENVKIKWKDLNVSSEKCAVRNLWEKKDLGEFIKECNVKINSHGAILLKVTPVQNK